MNREDGAALALAYSDPRKSGQPVLLVHGIAHNRHVWGKAMRELPSGLRPIAVDLRGHGESPWSVPGKYDLPDHAADLARLVDDLQIDRAIVVAHSLGGNAATLFAAGNPDRVLGLVLVDTGPALDASAIAHVADEVGSVLRSYASTAEYRGRLSQTHPSGDPEILDRLASTGIVRRLDDRFEPAIDPAVLGAGAEETDLKALERSLWAALRSVRCPVLVVRGGVSAILSEQSAREMIDAIGMSGRLVTLPTAGHAVMIDDGPGLLRAIRDFAPLAAVA